MKEYIKNRIDFLEEFIRNSSDKTTVNSVTDTAFYSYRHANRLFTKLKGESINSYSSKIRLQIAADYLKYSTKRILDIALDAGYESTAAFSKAFKKLYEQAPSRFRQENNLGHILKQKNVKEPQYTVVRFNQHKLYTHKVNITSNITHEKLYQKTKSTIEELCINANEWILSWDEDPELTKTAESRYFIGFTVEKTAQELYNFNSLTLHGNYAVFDTDDFKAFEYEFWHRLAYLILDLDDIQLREDNYLEWFSRNSLDALHAFFPTKIAIPI